MGQEEMLNKPEPVGNRRDDDMEDDNIFRNLLETTDDIPEPARSQEEILELAEKAAQARKAREAAENKAKPGIIAAIKRRLLGSEEKKDKVA